MGQLNMSLSVIDRLANRKADKAYRNEVYPPNVAMYGEGRGAFKVVYFESVGKAETYFRNVKDSSDVVKRLGHTGWYTDSCHETARGIVAQLPARGGECRYVAGLACTGEDTVMMEASESYTDEEEAARRGDRLAEKYAERAREFYAMDCAQMTIESLREENKGLGVEVLKLRGQIAELRECGKAHGAAARTIASVVESRIETIQANHEQCKALAENFWLAVEN